MAKKLKLNKIVGQELTNAEINDVRGGGSVGTGLDYIGRLILVWDGAKWIWKHSSNWSGVASPDLSIEKDDSGNCL